MTPTPRLFWRAIFVMNPVVLMWAAFGMLGPQAEAEYDTSPRSLKVVAWTVFSIVALSDVVRFIRWVAR